MKDLVIVLASSVMILLSLISAKQDRVNLVQVFEYYEKLKADRMMVEQVDQARETIATQERNYVNSQFIAN